MPDRERAADRGSRLARRDVVAVGADLRTARIMAGKTLEDVGRAVGMSYSNVGRIERAALASVTLTQLARIGAVVGLDVRVRAYPGPTPLRDAGQIALFDRLRARLASTLVMRTEVPLQIEGDLRAWDAVIFGFEPAADPLHAEGETRLYDAQAQLRRIALKARLRGRHGPPRDRGYAAQSSGHACRRADDHRGISDLAARCPRCLGGGTASGWIGVGVRVTLCME